MNTMTLGDKPIYDPPPASGKVNYFETHTGASRWGCGEVVMLRSDYDALVAAGSTSTLKMGSAFVGGGASPAGISVPVHIAGATPLSTALDQSKDMVCVVLFDKRSTYLYRVVKAYNVQQDGFPIDGSGNPVFWASTTTGGMPKNWSDVQADLELGAYAWPTWKPRNLIFDGIPRGRAVDDVCGRLSIVAAYDWATESIVLYDPDTLDAANQALQATAEKQGAWCGGRQTAKVDARMPATLYVTFRAVGGSDPFATRSYVKSVSTGHARSNRNDQALHVGEYIAVVSGGGVVNTAELDAVAADMAARVVKAMAATVDEREYAGIWPFKLDGRIRGIRWVNDSHGARTILRMNDDRDFNPMAESRRVMELRANQLLTGLGSSQVTANHAGGKFLVGGGKPQLWAAFNGTSSAGSGGNAYRGSLTAGLPNGLPPGPVDLGQCLIYNGPDQRLSPWPPVDGTGVAVNPVPIGRKAAAIDLGYQGTWRAVWTEVLPDEDCS